MGLLTKTDLPDVLYKKRQRALEAAHRYANADRSDPFTLRRILSRMDADQGAWGDQNGPLWDATEKTETVNLDPPAAFSDGTTQYQRKRYVDLKEMCS